MNPEFKIPPTSIVQITSPQKLAERLSCLIGRSFPLTHKNRTDGANMRKLVASMLEKSPLPPPATTGSYIVIPPRKKGLPKILREFMDTCIVTSGKSYNLQVWNRNPSVESVQIEYDDGTDIKANQVRFVFIPVDNETNKIKSVIVLTPDYIVKKIGKFGKETVKHQLMISSKARDMVLSSENCILFHDDYLKIVNIPDKNKFKKLMIQDSPNLSLIYPLSHIKELAKKLIGQCIPANSTKIRGQHLERIIASLLGYNFTQTQSLAGGYPDIRHQALEIKIQDSQTIDLGEYTPEFEEPAPNCDSTFTTRNMRYLIALTNPKTECIDGIILCPGGALGKHFTYVSDKSFKCQRSIAMSFFNKYSGKAVYEHNGSLETIEKKTTR